VTGLFTVDGLNNNLAGGIGPYDPNQGNTSTDHFNSQTGIADSVDNSCSGPNGCLNNILEIGLSNVAVGSTVTLLMQQGDSASESEFQVYAPSSTTAALNSGDILKNTLTNSTTPTSTGAMDGNAASPGQFSFTMTAGTTYIAITPDCQYLLLDQIQVTPTTHQGTPEPRFYGLLLISMLAIPAIRRRFVPQQ